MNVQYPISGISRLRIQSDGDGIRTLILVSGCNLRCKYCINPFTWDGSEQPQMLTVSEIYNRICIDRPYILATNGGITFGGGEPLLYPNLISEIRHICEQEMTVYVETSLNVPLKNIETTAEDVDKYYIDIKITDAESYRKYTGGSLATAIDNLKRLIEIKPTNSVVVRIPQIPGFVDEDKQTDAKETLKSIGVEQFDLFRYRV